MLKNYCFSVKLDFYFPDKNQTEIRPNPLTLLSRKYKILWKSTKKFWVRTRVYIHKNLSFHDFFFFALRA